MVHVMLWMFCYLVCVGWFLGTSWHCIWKDVQTDVLYCLSFRRANSVGWINFRCCSLPGGMYAPLGGSDQHCPNLWVRKPALCCFVSWFVFQRDREDRGEFEENRSFTCALLVKIRFKGLAHVFWLFLDQKSPSFDFEPLWKQVCRCSTESIVVFPLAKMMAGMELVQD